MQTTGKRTITGVLIGPVYMYTINQPGKTAYSCMESTKRPVWLSNVVMAAVVNIDHFHKAYAGHQ